MNSFEFIRQGATIVTADGVLARFTTAFKDEKYGKDHWVFRSPLANNIGDNIVRNGVFRITDGWRFATEKEIKRLVSLSEKDSDTYNVKN